MSPIKLRAGIDVGSTTIKAIVIGEQTGEILWQDYQRHKGSQAEKLLEFLKRIEAEFPDVPSEGMRVCITGSGGKSLSKHIGVKYTQEVSAVCLAVEKLHPETGSVIELGGQDAKIILFKEDPKTGRKRKIFSMNDKCAGGTGAVIDKISAKLGIPVEELCDQGFHGIKLHHVAGKCGVFAETDINSLQMQRVPTDQLMASLFEALVGQNLSVLTRGHTLQPVVLLLGGPNTFIRGMQEAWRANIPLIWEEREFLLPEGIDPQEQIKVPDNAQYFGAIGAVEYSRKEDVGLYAGWSGLEYYLTDGRKKEMERSAAGLWKSRAELEEFKEKYHKKPFNATTFGPGELVEAFIGLDGGSTSTKAVLMNRAKDVLAKAYQLSKGNPIEDTKDIFAKLRDQVESAGATLEILGVGVTGYAKDVLKDILRTDTAIVETVAHTEAALHFYENVDVICDIGGQDIKIMFLKNGKVKDFKLNTQCSAGNGYFLQSTTQDFRIPVEHYADMAFEAEAMPNFSYGCAIFMQSDIVNFQRQGWKPQEIMAGLASVLPKNIWLYVAQIPNLARLGTNFVLQGGTQHNLAAVKAQVDFIEARFRGKEEKPNIVVHEHCGESGAIGAALETIRLWKNGRKTTFIGLEATDKISYKTTTNEDTHCYFCKNKCMRTFIDIAIAGQQEREHVGVHHMNGPHEQRTAKLHARDSANNGNVNSKVPLAQSARRLIVGNSCEKGSVEDLDGMREIRKEINAKLHATPNFVDLSAKEAFGSFSIKNVSDSLPRIALTRKTRRRSKLIKGRAEIRIGIPRVLNIYSVAPLFNAYFESLGIPYKNLVYSDYTSDKLYREGVKRGSIDPCYPSKLAIPHIHNLIYTKHARNPLDVIFFPMIDDLPSIMVDTHDFLVCPTITATPEVVKAAFVKEGNLFEKKGITFLNTFVNIGRPTLFERQLYHQFKDILGLSKGEHARAIQAGYAALDKFNKRMLSKAKATLKRLEKENRIGIVLLSRPYHNDQGINHDIAVEFQKRGYPIFTPDSLPVGDEILNRLFGNEVQAGIISHPMDISDVWKNTSSEISGRKLWAAKYAARHPNLVALEMSNFKCGHDATIYTVVEEIVDNSGTPYFSFKDLDENRPAGSIKIRVETINYFLKRHREDMIRMTEKRKLIIDELIDYEKELRGTLVAAG